MHHGTLHVDCLVLTGVGETRIGRTLTPGDTAEATVSPAT